MNPMLRYPLHLLTQTIGLGAIMTCGCAESPNAKESPLLYRTLAGQVQTEQTGNPAERDTPIDAPKCVFTETSYDFGAMAADEHGAHTFTFRNEGESALEVEVVDSTCKCVLSEVGEEPIPPGESGELRVEWVTRHTAEPYQQTVTLRTNDPRRERIEIAVRGEISLEFAFRPSPVTLPTVHQHEPIDATVSLLSGQWDAFSVEEITPELGSIEWELTPLSATRVEAAGASSGYELALKLPAGMPKGQFRHDVTMKVTPTDPPGDTREFTLPIVGEVMGRLRLSGKGVDSDGVIRTSVRRGGDPTRMKLLLKVRDPEHPLLKLADTEISHPCLTARLEPTAERLAKKGLHYLHLEIDGRRMTESLAGDNRIDLKLRFDHPTVSGLEVKVEAVLAQSQGG